MGTKQAEELRRMVIVILIGVFIMLATQIHVVFTSTATTYQRMQRDMTTVMQTQENYRQFIVNLYKDLNACKNMAQVNNLLDQRFPKKDPNANQ